MKFFKDHYEVVIIGGALAGMSAALQLQAKGVTDILILADVGVMILAVLNAIRCLFVKNVTDGT